MQYKYSRAYLRALLLLLSLLVPGLGYAGVDLVWVDKSERRMYLIEQGEVVRSYKIALGDSPKGHKQQEGDERTPEGRYILDYKKEDSAFHRSMHISYPNEEDKARAKARGVSPGGFIMVHGLGWRSVASQRQDWTDGCIAISNHEMDEFMALVAVGTPIQIEW